VERNGFLYFKNKNRRFHKMFNNLTLIQQGNNYYVDSRDVANIIGKQHKNLLRDIATYINYMKESIKLTFEPNDFFLENSYVDSIGRTMPCYLLSKMGCSMVANKLNGEKGVLFTAAYITRFNEMENYMRSEREKDLLSKPTLSDCNDTAKIVVEQLRRTGISTEKIIEFLNELYEPFGLLVADGDEFSHIPYTYTATQIAHIYGMYSMYGNPHAQAVSCLLNENIFISKDHKINVSANYETGIIGGFRYDEYALERVGNWLADYNYPGEIYGFDRTYHILYSKE
jgi:Rha family phage regulatory protein